MGTSPKQHLASFISQIVDSYNITSALLYHSSTFNVFSEVKLEKINECNNIEGIDFSLKYSLILGDMPFGMNMLEPGQGQTKTPLLKGHADILRLCSMLNEKGKGLFIIEPIGLSNKYGKALEKKLASSGFFVNAYFRCPKGLLEPETKLVPLLVLLSRTDTPMCYVADLEDAPILDLIIANYQSGKGDRLEAGKWIGKGSFRGFGYLKQSERIERLQTQYKSYKEYTLSEIAVSATSIADTSTFHNTPNTIFIPRIGNSPVISKLENIQLKVHNYFAITLPNTILNEYAALYFRSELGKLSLAAMTNETFIPHLNLSDLKKVTIAVPSIEEQEQIIEVYKKLTDLKYKVETFENELALNPMASSQITQQVDSMLNTIGLLSEGDRVRAVIREGESKTTEFKQTIVLDVKTQRKETYIELEAVKTIVAFLNTDGGVLIVGVDDNGKILGVDQEICKLYKNIDHFLLNWKNIVKSRIGEQYYPFIDSRLVNIDSINVLKVECKPSQKPCFLDKKDFYVRTNPATDKLEGPTLVDYVRNHFKD